MVASNDEPGNDKKSSYKILVVLISIFLGIFIGGLIFAIHFMGHG
jgi:flagellar basal body-associated protein FliL